MSKRSNDKIGQMTAAVTTALSNLEKFFNKDMKLTFIARMEGDNNCDIFISADTPEALTALLQRTSARMLLKPADGAKLQ